MASPGTPIEPEVLFPSGGSPGAPGGASPVFQGQFLPSFPTMAGWVDRFARRIPWWTWVGLTLAAVWWSGRRKHKRRIVEEG